VTLSNPRTALWLTLTAFAAAFMLHVDQMPLWCSTAAILALLWRGGAEAGLIALPGTVLRTLLTLALIAATMASFRTLSGLTAGGSLLLVMGAAKLLETRDRRDAVIVVVVSLTLLMAACLDRQSLPRLPLYVIVGWVACAALAALGGSRESRSVQRAFARAGTALLLGLPFALVCFVFVPRLPGALWGVPGSSSAQTGLDDQMSPGSISDLSLSDEPAFRVRFDGPLPKPEARYWRGPVLHDFDGYTWRRIPGQAALAHQAEYLGPALRYHVMLEAHSRNWLYGLDSVKSVSQRGARIDFDGQIRMFRAVTAPLAYDAESYLNSRFTQPLSLLGRRIDTRLPKDRNPRALALAATMRAQASDDVAYTRAVLNYFRDGGFRYTLTPPLLNFDSIDDLLFNTRLGFCGHFASAYVTLMRAAGIPARVVTGYLGGEWNSVGDYLLVRQSGAHAWAEVWIEGRGWVRVDPTAVVAPERLQQGLRDLLPGSGSAASRVIQGSAWLRAMRDRWDATNNWWQERVINFNLGTQLDLMRYLGLGTVDYRQLALLLVGGAGVWAFAAILWMRRKPVAVKPDAVARLWLKFIVMLKRHGLRIPAHEPPMSIARRAAHALPGLAKPIHDFTQTYVRLRYGTPDREADLAALRNDLRRLRAHSR
jgi:protein-glutamine gamma-glutamyltransferase